MLAAWRAWAKIKEGKMERPVIRNKGPFYAQLIVGIIAALSAAFFMLAGDILGENTSGIATIIGIVGISLIATSGLP